MSGQSVPLLGIGMVGTAFMGRAHSRAFTMLRGLEDAPAALPVLRVLCGRDPDRLETIRQRYGWQLSVRDWREVIEDPGVEVFDNAAPNSLHAEPSIAAFEAGKHVLCEKPLGRDVSEARAMCEAAERSGRVHMCAFNYRFFPAIRLARLMIERGDIGELFHFRSRFLLPFGTDPSTPAGWRQNREIAGAGVIGDLLSHHVDLARYLVGEPSAVTAISRIWAKERGGAAVEVEDSVAATVEFAGGAMGTMEATIMTPGHPITSIIEIDGSEGSLAFSVRRLNELKLSRSSGETTIAANAPEHPFAELWWPPGHGVGWGDSFVHELRHFLGAVAGAWEVAPHGASFLDGYRCAQVCDAVLTAARTGVRQEIAA